MLSREIMGLLALAILWVNTLLIAAAAGKELLALLARRQKLRLLGPIDRGDGILRGVVVRGEGPGGAFAEQRVDQIGRSARPSAAGRSIHFSDKAFEGEIFGGVLLCEIEPGRQEEVVIEPSRPAEVWLSADDLRRASGCPSLERFEQMYEDAKRARGAARTVKAVIEPGRTVWVAVEREREPEGRLSRISNSSMSPPSAAPPMIAVMNPRALCSTKIALVLGSILAMLGLAAAASAVALHEPRFGLVSTLGGALCLAFFLLVQPAGTALRDAVRLPHRALLRGSLRERELPSGPSDGLPPS